MSDDSDTLTASDATRNSPRRHAAIYGLLVLLFALQSALGAYVFFRFEYQPAVIDSGPSPEWVEGVETELQTFKDELSALQAQVKEMSDTGDDTTRFNLQQESLRELSTRLDRLEQEEEQTQIAGPKTEWQFEQVRELIADVQTLRERIEQTGEARWKTIELLTTFDRLEQRILAHEPYTQALEAFRLAAQDLPQVNMWARHLMPYRHEGIPGWAQLIAQYESARNAALAPSLAKEGDWWQEMVGNLSGLVHVRKTGPMHGGDDVDAVLARAAYALQQHEPHTVLDELRNLPEAEQEIFTEFVNSLRDRLSILALLPDIRETLQAHIEASR